VAQLRHWQAVAEAAQADMEQLRAELDAAQHATLPTDKDTSADTAMRDAQQAVEAAQQQAAYATAETEQQRAAAAAAAADAKSAQQELDSLRQRMYSLEGSAAAAAEARGEQQRAQQQAEQWQAAADAAQAAAAEAQQQAEALRTAADEAALQCEALATQLAAEREAHAAVQQELSCQQVLILQIRSSMPGNGADPCRQATSCAWGPYGVCLWPNPAAMQQPAPDTQGQLEAELSAERRRAAELQKQLQWAQDAVGRQQQLASEGATHVGCGAACNHRMLLLAQWPTMLHWT
jgi:hypothetical protein